MTRIHETPPATEPRPPDVNWPAENICRYNRDINRDNRDNSVTSFSALSIAAEIEQRMNDKTCCFSFQSPAVPINAPEPSGLKRRRREKLICCVDGRHFRCVDCIFLMGYSCVYRFMETNKYKMRSHNICFVCSITSFTS